MSKSKSLIAISFVVSWAAGNTYQKVDCVKEPPGITCAKAIEQRKEQPFKSKEAAEAFQQVMTQVGAQSVKLEERK